MRVGRETMHKDDDFCDSMLEEMDHISAFLADFAGNASILLKNRDEDGFIDLVLRASVDIYDYRRGKALKMTQKTDSAARKDGWTIY